MRNQLPLVVDGVRKYRIRWANKEKVDVRVLADWEYAFIKERITYLKKKHVRWRKLQVLRTSKHLMIFINIMCLSLLIRPVAIL